jgi:hypothetical protein
MLVLLFTVLLSLFVLGICYLAVVALWESVRDFSDASAAKIARLWLAGQFVQGRIAASVFGDVRNRVVL